jgi:hypothetical protein
LNKSLLTAGGNQKHINLTYDEEEEEEEAEEEKKKKFLN